MKNTFGLVIVVLVLMTAAWECSIGEAKLTSLKTSKDKDGKTESTTFKAGETLYAIAEIGGSSKTTTKFRVDDDKGETITTDVKVDLPRNGTATYTLPLPASVPGGKYTLHAEMLDEKGEKKDAKSVAITIEGGSNSKADDKKKKEEAGEEDDDK
ncbi:MAG: hypothetical protein IPM59_11880 [Chloracidobacterium sp.]|nr:hypothetical protein [Chloracidobacterium sp.]